MEVPLNLSSSILLKSKQTIVIFWVVFWYVKYLYYTDLFS
jgi:hypothetical protein